MIHLWDGETIKVHAYYAMKMNFMMNSDFVKNVVMWILTVKNVHFLKINLKTCLNSNVFPARQHTRLILIWLLF